MNHEPPLDAAILEQIADAMIYADHSGAIRRWNRAAQTLFGYSATEALGQSLDIVIPEHLRPLHWRGFAAAMANGHLALEGRPTRTRAQHRSGATLYVEMTFSLVRCGADEGALGAVAVARDIMDRDQSAPPPRRDSAAS